MTIQHLYPTTRPSLDLNFARQKRLDPRVTFTRGSTATYVGSDGLIKTAASNEARFDHDPVTGESLGLLNEWSRTNSVQYSHEFDNSYWTKENTTITANATVAPDGTNTADKLVGTTVNGLHRIYRNAGLSATNGQPYTASCFFKASELSRCSVSIYDTSYKIVSFDLSAGTITDTSTGATGAITPFNNGWYRCSITITVAATALDVHFFALDDDGNSSWLGNGTDGLFSWGAQLEQGSSPTSYIPTSGATVTRAAEVTTITGTNFSSWYNQTEGTFILDERNSYSSFGGDVRFEVVQDSSPTTNAICVNVNYGAGTRITSRDANTTGTIDRLLANVWTSGGSHKFAYGIEENNVSVVAGTNVATDTSCTLPSNLDSLSIGGQGRTVTNVNPVGRVNIARLTYYPTRLTDAQLQALTL